MAMKAISRRFGVAARWTCIDPFPLADRIESRQI
jgi:hypothetical protein